jgi:hypothetical protein
VYQVWPGKNVRIVFFCEEKCPPYFMNIDAMEYRCFSWMGVWSSDLIREASS